MQEKINRVLAAYGLSAQVSPFGNGHINHTFVIPGTPRYLLQRISRDVFPDPIAVMENISKTTRFLQKKIAAGGGDPTRQALTLLPTLDGKDYFVDEDGETYRIYLFIEESFAYETAPETPEQFALSAHAFGEFQKLLAEFPAEELKEVIPKFHDTANRLKQFRQALEKDAAGRAASVQPEIEFVLAHASIVSKITDAIADGSVPLRVTHNDTKLNNILFDANTKQPLCVIDLDTVMPGSLLYDYGDALRFGASTGAEDETDLSKIEFDLTYFKAFTKAYLEELGDVLTPMERELLPLSALMMTLECGIRFLTDHLNGDVYFRIHRPNHNLDRAHTQFKLVADMEAKMEQMKAIVAEC
ncbi:MAG: aminoglycoside phosphotransferase family protein [Clostridia bacterium]|nr:aminoglycoside phosphotransferase family protein [Clostridia bacterium]